MARLKPGKYQPARVAEVIETSLEQAVRGAKYAKLKTQKAFYKGQSAGIMRLATKLGWDCTCDARKTASKRFCYCKRG